MTTTPDFRALLADDAYAASFQSMGQYRTALLKALATPPPEPPTIGGVEDAAKAIYSDAMTWAAANPNGGAVPP